MMRLYCWSAGAVVAVWSTVLVGSTSAAPSVYLSSPTNGGSYLIPQTTTTTSIALEYQLFGITDTEEYSQYELCFDVVARKEGKKAVDWTCISSQHRQLVMKDLGSGEYLLTGTLQRLGSNGVGNQVLEETRVTSIFTIYSYEEASPQLQLVAVNNEAVEHTAQESRIALAANPTTSKADLSVQYGYTTSLLDHAFFATCASIEDNDKKVVLPWTCLAAKDRQFTLNNIHIGNYNLHLMLRDIRLTGDASYLLRSKVQKAIDVKAMDDVLPRLTILNPVQEYMLDETTHTAPQVDVQYQLEGSSSVIKQLAVCVEIHKKDTEHSVLLPWNCLPTSSNLFSLSRVPGGEYTVLVVLASNVDNSLQYTSTMQKFTLSIRPAVEFEPTYDWRPLHAWHTIPSGIETR